MLSTLPESRGETGQKAEKVAMDPATGHGGSSENSTTLLRFSRPTYRERRIMTASCVDFQPRRNEKSKGTRGNEALAGLDFFLRQYRLRDKYRETAEDFNPCLIKTRGVFFLWLSWN